jgi:hypothetical protein
MYFVGFDGSYKNHVYLVILLLCVTTTVCEISVTGNVVVHREKME